MKFDYIIGNPPYQEETESDSTRMPPIYDKFMNGVYSIANKVCLVTPARFLFNAGWTSKEFNNKMLSDPHLKVLDYEPNSSKYFPNTDIKGGVAITYRDALSDFGAIELFIKDPILNKILKKVASITNGSLSEIMAPALSFKLSNKMISEHPELINRLRSNAFSKLSPIFFENKPIDEFDYIKMIGILEGKRVYRYVRKDYILDTHNMLEKYKVILPGSNGSGAIGEVFSTPLIGTPLIGTPLIGYTQTFIGIGRFDTCGEAEACLKYIKTKFARAMLGILKITQSNPPGKWKYVPLQDFTSNSDIDWSQSIPDIDQQLYKKYGLDESEIAFIEEKVKEMN